MVWYKSAVEGISLEPYEYMVVYGNEFGYVQVDWTVGKCCTPVQWVAGRIVLTKCYYTNITCTNGLKYKNERLRLTIRKSFGSRWEMFKYGLGRKKHVIFGSQLSFTTRISILYDLTGWNSL